jgi:protein phosphatase
MANETEITLPAVDVAERSDPGRDPTKKVNEDACGHRETRFGLLAVVCDGMGGHVGGREASTAALATIFEAFEKAPVGSQPREVLRDAIRLANVRVRGLGVASEEGGGGGRPGSTVVTVLVHGGGTEIAHVGDSRAYLVQAGQVFQLTRDHSMVQEMVDAKLLSPEQAAAHPDANKITRALGIDDDVQVDVRPQSFAHVSGDTFVLCTDGLSDLVEGPDILRIVSGEPLEQAAGKLVDLANARGGHDNITVVLVRPKTSAPAAIPGVSATVVGDATTLRPPAVPPRMGGGGGGGTQPLYAVPVVGPAVAIIPSAPPSTALPSVRATRSTPTSVALGIALAVVGVVVLVAILVVHTASSRPKAAALFDAGSVIVTGAPRPSASVVLAPVAPPIAEVPDASDLAPLTPLTPAPMRHSRTKPN